MADGTGRLTPPGQSAATTPAQTPPRGPAHRPARNPLGLGRLGLWWHFRHGVQQPIQPVDLPTIVGDGRVLLHVSEGTETAAQQVCRKLLTGRRNLAILRCGSNDIPNPGDVATAEALIAATQPRCLLLLGNELPAALIIASERAGVPMILAEARFGSDEMGWSMQAAMRRHLLAGMQVILVTDPGSYAIALRMGADQARVRMTGPVAEIREPLTCNERERITLAQLMRGRHAWFAAAVPEAEERAVLDAHHAALQHSHRALLFLAPADPARIDPLADIIEAGGLTVARRTLDEDPEEDVHVMITDGPTEMGLWYRLAPVTYLGGTLSGEDHEARHPFEPASLGSAIVHGPVTGRHPTEWQQLDDARAARPVANAEALATAVTELSQADLTAALASAAWTVSTGGAEVTMSICAPVLAALDREAA